LKQYLYFLEAQDIYEVFDIHRKQTIKLNIVERPPRDNDISHVPWFLLTLRDTFTLCESRAQIKSITLTTAKTHSHAYARALFLMAWYLWRHV